MDNLYGTMPLSTVNLVFEGDDSPIEFKGKVYGGFYVSYNFTRSDYGCPTTALVLGQMQRFFILKGDHRKQYQAIISQGFRPCLAYYVANIDMAHSYSDKV